MTKNNTLSYLNDLFKEVYSDRIRETFVKGTNVSVEQMSDDYLKIEADWGSEDAKKEIEIRKTPLGKFLRGRND